MKSILIPVIIAMLGLTVGACDDTRVASGNHHEEKSQSTLVKETNQFPSVGQSRLDLAVYGLRVQGQPFCRPSQFQRISLDSALGYIKEINFPSKETAQEILFFASEHQNQIIPLLGEVPTNHGPSTILQFVYSSDIEVIPSSLGCKQGVHFNLTKLGVWGENGALGPIPRPTACNFTVGDTGECCHCDSDWSDEDGCTSTFNCPQNNCCSDGGSESTVKSLCDSVTPPSYWKDSTPLQELPIGAFLK